MPIPDKVRIAGHEYRVTQVQGIIDPEKRNVYGRCCNEGMEILLDATRPPSQIWVTFLHELIHAISYRYFYNSLFTGAKEEEMVDRLAEALFQVLMDLDALPGERG